MSRQRPPQHSKPRTQITECRATTFSGQQNAFIDAAINQGHPEVIDFNSDLNEGVGTLSMNIINGVRVNTGMTYLDQPVRRRENLTIRSGIVADRVEFSGKRARAIVSTIAK